MTRVVPATMGSAPNVLRRSRGARIVTAALAASVSWPALASAKQPAGWNATFWAEQAYSDNLQEQPGPDKQEDFFTTLTARAAWLRPARPQLRLLPQELAVSVQGRVYTQFSNFDYFELHPEAVYHFSRTEFLLRYSYTPRRILFEEEDGGDNVFYSEYAATSGVEHKFGANKKLRAKLLFEAAWQDFRHQFDGRNSFTPTTTVEARYLLSPFFTPRLGGEFARREARQENFDRDAFKLITGFDSQLSHMISVRFTYRHYWRDYTTDAERASDGRPNNNFGRDDEIDQYEVWVATLLPALPDLTVRGRYRFRDGDSNRQDRIFNMHEFGIEFSYSLWWLE